MRPLPLLANCRCRVSPLSKLARFLSGRQGGRGEIENEPWAWRNENRRRDKWTVELEIEPQSFSPHKQLSFSNSPRFQDQRFVAGRRCGTLTPAAAVGLSVRLERKTRSWFASDLPKREKLIDCF